MLERAAALGRHTVDAGLGGPFGAVIVRDGSVIGEGANTVIGSRDPTAHAEVNAIRDACRKLGDFSLAGSELYTTCEPCPMCLAATYWARIERIWYASTRSDAQAIGFDDDLFYRELGMPPDARSVPAQRVPCTAASDLFQHWHNKADKVPY